MLCGYLGEIRYRLSKKSGEYAYGNVVNENAGIFYGYGFLHDEKIMVIVLTGMWVGQALLLGTFLSALESEYGLFTLYWWAYAYGMFWPFIWVYQKWLHQKRVWSGIKKT